MKLAERVAASGRRLKAIVITHAHPDHYFGIGPLLQRFPGTPVYMTAAALAEFRREVRPKIAQWTPVFGAEIPTDKQRALDSVAARAHRERSRLRRRPRVAGRVNGGDPARLAYYFSQ